MSKLNLSDPITLRLPNDMLTAVEEIAEACERSRSWVIVRALKTYLASEGADILVVKKARQEVARGEVYDMDDVLAELKSIARGDAA